MKIFVNVILAATIIGGFVGGELMGRTFSLTGAVIGGVGLAAVLLGLGAFFDSQDRRRRQEQLPNELRPVFDRMLRGIGRTTAGARPSSPANALPPQASNGTLRSSEVGTLFLDQFIQAMVRLGATKSATDLRAMGRPLISQFANPYIAAMDAYVTMLGALAKPGIEGASQMGSGVAHGVGAICEFVLEGKVPHEIGKTYFDQVMEFMNFGISGGLRASGPIMVFENMLELHRSMASERGKSPPLALSFSDATDALDYACKYLECPLYEGGFLPALVLDFRQLAGVESPVIIEKDGNQLTMLRVASDDGGFRVFASTAGTKGPKLKPGQLVAWRAGKFSAEFFAAMSVKDKRAGWVGIIIGTLKNEYRDGNWVVDEKFSL